MIVFLLVALPMLAVACYILLPQSWRALRGDDPFRPLSDEWKEPKE